MFGLQHKENQESESAKLKPAALARFFSDNHTMTDEVRIYMGIQAAIGAGFNNTTSNADDAKRLEESKSRIGEMIEASGKTLDGEVDDFITEVGYRISN